MSRFVLLSFTVTLDEVAGGLLKETDLREAIFCFGCNAEWPYADPERIIIEHGSYQQRKIAVSHVEMVARYLREAEGDGRAVWRRGSSPSKVHQDISAALKRCDLQPLNPNLPPIAESAFLKTAIERVNNRDGIERVVVIL